MSEHIEQIFSWTALFAYGILIRSAFIYDAPALYRQFLPADSSSRFLIMMRIAVRAACVIPGIRSA